MRSALLAPLLLAAVALAGCSGDAGGAKDLPEAAASASLSGTGTPPAAPTPPPPPTETPLRIEGSTAAGGCAAAAGEELCHYEMTETAFHELDAPGRPLRLVGVLTWDAASPASETLTLYVPEVRSDGFHWEPGYPVASGTSPLEVDLDLQTLGDARIGLIVGNGVVQPSPVGYAAVQAPQAFVLEAVLSTTA